MLTRVKTATLTGIKGYCVTVEIDIHKGLPALNVTGLADATIKESFMRIKPAIMNSGYYMPRDKVTVNLMPAGKPKEGSHFDLPMAVGIVVSGSNMKINGDVALFGELSLDGRVNPVRGALPLAMCARENGIKKIIIPYANASEVEILEDMELIPVKDLKDAIGYVEQGKLYHEESLYDLYKRKQNKKNRILNTKIQEELDFIQVKGQESAKRALMIAVAGGHGALMIGGPGCGKSMMAKRIPTIMPDLTYEEKLEVTGIYSVANLLSEENPVIHSRPFRAPHHRITSAGLIGGGVRPRPGELSLAHKGVLFLDELGEFDIKSIDAMRQPIEDGYVRINRNFEEIIFPSDVMIVAAANPCKCGNLWDEKKTCICTEKQIASYRRKLSGPFSDRIDMHIKIPNVAKEAIEEKYDTSDGIISSSYMKSKVEEARKIQRERYEGTGFSSNGKLGDENVREFCKMTPKASAFMVKAYGRLGLSVRGYIKMLKTARTIADMEKREIIGEDEVSEALMYRIGDWV